MMSVTGPGAQSCTIKSRSLSHRGKELELVYSSNLVFISMCVKCTSGPDREAHDVLLTDKLHTVNYIGNVNEK